MEIKDMNLEQLNARVAEIRQAMQAQDADIDALNKEMDAIEARRAELNTAETARRSLAARVASGAVGTVRESVGAETHTRTLDEVRSSAEYMDAYATYLRTGNAEELRTLTTDLIENSETLSVPTVVEQAVEAARHSHPIFDNIRTVEVDGLIKQDVETTAGDACEHTENGEAPDEEELNLAPVTIDPDYITKWKNVTSKLLAMRGQTVMDYLNEEITYKVVDLAENQIVDVIEASALTESAGSVAAASFAYANILAVTAKAWNVKEPCYIMTRDTYFNKVMTLADQNNRPIWNIIMENGKPQYVLLGAPVYFSDAANGILYGDLKAVLGNFPEGKRVGFISDPYTLAQGKKVKVVGSMLAGFGLVRPKAFAKLTITA